MATVLLVWELMIVLGLDLLDWVERNMWVLLVAALLFVLAGVWWISNYL